MSLFAPFGGKGLVCGSEVFGASYALPRAFQNAAGVQMYPGDVQARWRAKRAKLEALRAQKQPVYDLQVCFRPSCSSISGPLFARGLAAAPGTDHRGAS